MKKRYYLLLIPLLCLCITNVKAKVELKATGGERVTFDGRNGNHYEIKVDGKRAFCTELGKKLSSTANFNVTGNSGGSGLGNSEIIKKGLVYAQTHNDAYTDRVVSDLVWSHGNVDAVLKAEPMAGEILNEINNTDAGNTQVCTLDGGAENQKLISVSENCETTEPCRISTTNEPPGCGDDSEFHIGYILEQTSGNCPDSYDVYTKPNAIKVGAGDTQFGDYCRMYCLKDLEEKFPGKITKTIDSGRYIVWPNNNMNNNKYKTDADLTTYPMKITLNKKCKISADKPHLKEDMQKEQDAMKKLRAKDKKDPATEGCDEYIKNDNCSYSKQQWDYWKKQVKYWEEQVSYWSGQVAHLCNPCCESWTDDDGSYCDVCSGCANAQSQLSHAEKKKKEAEKERDKWEKQNEICEEYMPHNIKARDIVKKFNPCIDSNTSNDISFNLINPRSTTDDPEYGGEFKLYAHDQETSICKDCEPNDTEIPVSDDPVGKKRIETYPSPSELEQKASNVEKREIIKSDVAYYDITEENDGYYHYINMETLKSVSKKPEKNYTTIGFSNMPISLDIEKLNTTPDYYSTSIKIDGITGSGGNGQGLQNINGALKDNKYICKYSVGTICTDHCCVCPPDSDYPGMSLDKYLTDNTKTCADVQSELCYKPGNYCPEDSDCPKCQLDEHMEKENLTYSEAKEKYCYTDYVCPPGTPKAGESYKDKMKKAHITSREVAISTFCYEKQCFCPPKSLRKNANLDEEMKKRGITDCTTAQKELCDNTPSTCNPAVETCEYKCPDGRDLTTCIGSGLTLSECKTKICTIKCTTSCNGRKWVCPKGGTNEGMDLTSCVFPMLIKGLSEQAAYEYCRDVTCPYKGLNIIYRTIDLSNPFPSKDADANPNKFQKGLTKDPVMFNNNLRGRYPGYNWNSVSLVKKEILTNRGKENDQVYKEEPLYTFNLNSQTIEQIRKYNRTTGNNYNDFNKKTFTCLKNNSAACKSEFVHDTTYGLTGGKCRKISKHNFYSCAE